jgi:hypothetical protein
MNDGRGRYRNGSGNWNEFDIPLSAVFELAKAWRHAITGVERPWQCWNVNPDWCLVQQDLAAHVGWTPVVGGDPRAGKPKLRPGAVWIDFNAGLDLPMLHMAFPLEFVFAWAPRLAFWHSDLLVRPHVLVRLAAEFASLADGEMAAVRRWGAGGLHLLQPRRHRFWELVGCTTSGASLSQWQHGCGWWKNFHLHPNVPSEAERAERARWYFDHGTGIMYWKRRHGGRVRPIPLRLVDEGHFSRLKLGAPEQRNETYDMPKEIERRGTLSVLCDQMGVTPVLQAS